MPDLHGWITQQIDETAHQARAAAKLQASQWICPSTGVVVFGSDLISTGDRNVAYHVVRHDPAAVLRRCTADRKILDIHKPAGNPGWDGHACIGCDSDDFGWNVGHTNDCPTLLALAEGYGLTDEQRAALDRPEPERPTPTGPSVIPDALAEAMARQLLDNFLGAQLCEPSPEKKALKILEPELKKIDGYVPMPEEAP